MILFKVIAPGSVGLGWLGLLGRLFDRLVGYHLFDALAGFDQVGLIFGDAVNGDLIEFFLLRFLPAVFDHEFLKLLNIIINVARADLAKGKWNIPAIADALTRIGLSTHRQTIWRLSQQQTPPLRTDPDPKTLEKLKKEIIKMSRESEKGFGLVDNCPYPGPFDKTTDITPQKQSGNGLAHNGPNILYKGEEVTCYRTVTLKEVRDVGTMLSISRLKFNRAVTAYRKRMNGDAPRDPVTIAIAALSVAAFGSENPELIIELIEIERNTL